MPTRILHISDLHFGRAFRESDRSLRDRLFQRGGLRAHDFQLVSALSAKAHRLAWQSGKFDLVIITGDVTTDGDSGSMANAAKLFSEEEIFSGTPGHFIVNGLKLVADSVVAIPGNHDRYKLVPLQLDFGRFESSFLEHGKGYPFAVAYSQADLPPGAEPTCPVILFVFDSTAVNNPPFGHKPLELIARGYIDDNACEWLKIKAHQIRSEGLVTGLDGKKLSVDYERCVKLALIHHHPVEFVGQPAPELLEAEKVVLRRREVTKKISDQWTTLMNREKFVDACFEAQMDMVLFGHQHLFLHRELGPDMKDISNPDISTRSIHFYGCPTTLQWAEAEIGFLVYKIEWAKFEVDYFGWKEEEQKFERNPYRCGTFPFRRGNRQ